MAWEFPTLGPPDAPYVLPVSWGIPADSLNSDAARTGLEGKTAEEGKNLYIDLHGGALHDPVG